MKTKVFLAILSVFSHFIFTHSKLKLNKFQAQMNEVCDMPVKTFVPEVFLFVDQLNNND